MNDEEYGPGEGLDINETANAIHAQDGVFDSELNEPATNRAGGAVDPEEEHSEGLEAYQLPDDVDPESGAPLQALAQDLGLSREQFGRLMEIREKSTQERDRAVAVEVENQLAEATVALRQKWGRNFAANGRLAERALTRFAPPELVADLKAGGWTREPGFIEFLHAVGARLGEDDLNAPKGQHQGGNPWSKGSANLTEQGRLMRENPALARSLAAQAGISLG